MSRSTRTRPEFVEAIEGPEIFGERALGQPDRISHLELRSQLQEPVRTRGGDEGFNDPGRSRMWPLPLHHDSRHTQRAIDRPPLIALGVENDEHVAREERRHYRRQLTGVSNGLLALGQKCAIALVLELDLSTLFLVWQRMNDEPSLAGGEVCGLTSGKGHRVRLVQRVRLTAS